MFYGENIVKLRQLNNMTQEDLAEKLGVSRQTIYKWETGVTYPDIDKAMDIAKLFHVSIDVLMNEDIQDMYIAKDEIIKKVSKFSLSIAICIFLILFGVAILTFMSSFQRESLEIIATAIMLCFIFIAVVIIVFSSMQYENFKKLYKPSVCFTKKELELENSHFVRYIIFGLICIFIGIVIVVSLSLLDEAIISYGVSILLLLIGIGVLFIVRGAIMHDMYINGEDFFKQDSEKKKKTDKKGAIQGAIMLTCTAIFLVWGLVFQGFHISWVVFPVGGIICGIVSCIMDSSSKEK